MPFQNSSNGFNNQNNSQGEKKRTNFPVGRLFATDAVMDIRVWVTDSSVFTIFSAKQAVGKDPSTGANVYEQKMPNELPRIFLNPEFLRAFLEAAKSLDAATGATGTITISPKKGSKMTVDISATGQVKITLESDKGTRTATFEPIPCGSTTINASWKNLIALCEVAMKKGLYAKLDPEEFGNALAASAVEPMNENASAELPI